jgi:NADPH-dependent glutamate synthase beta subunit-like oxidoreductase/glutamate synthase domain-containing protein 3/NAD-dependent dihydropyrimidine dehydrogenase PreA subunit
MPDTKKATISGRENGVRIETRILEERIQHAVADGARDLTVEAYGHHGVGGRLWISEKEPLKITVEGPVGQRLGCMGFGGTVIEAKGPTSDDVGWLNAGAEIIVHGDATNGAGNAMAQGGIFVGGSIGARGMTMTKHNPRFDPPELWVLGSVGDYFAEFMAGGIAVICGLDAKDPENVLGYRPCVGMVGGRIYFRGPHKGFSTADAKLEEINDADWQWLQEKLEGFLARIGREDAAGILTKREEWQSIKAKSPYERLKKRRRSMDEFRREVWDRELGMGGMVGDVLHMDRSPVQFIVSGKLRRYVPVWENLKYAPPCEKSCPTGIPVRTRMRLIREGKLEEAVDLALAYTPFPATVCGYLCPNLCMQSCTRGQGGLSPVDVPSLGKTSLDAHMPELPPLSGHRMAVIGGGPGGISAAWQLRLRGHEAVIYDMEKELGGKLTAAIPSSRIPAEVLTKEIERVREHLPHVQLEQKMTKDQFERLKDEYDFVVLATGAHTPRLLPIPGKELVTPALTFLELAKRGEAEAGERVVIIGAGNVGCDVAVEAARFGASDITLIDIQEPASFGKERKAAEAVGAKFRWPVFTREVNTEGVVLSDGELIPADTVIISIGEAPGLDFLPESIATERGFVTVNDTYQTTDARVFAVGDIVRPGLLTDAVGAGRRAAWAIDRILAGERPLADTSEMVESARARIEYTDRWGSFASEMIDTSRMTLAYFDPRMVFTGRVEECAMECSSCGECRDCGICEAICPQAAITRQEDREGEVAMVVDPDLCIGCGFCADSCPCGIWSLVPNEPL